jgi:hypothetical protein
VTVTADEVQRAVDEGFLAALAEPHLRAQMLWTGCPYPEPSTTAILWRRGYEAGWILRRQADHASVAIPEPGP